MRTKLNAMRLYLAECCQTENLKAAAVGQDRQGPVDESMQAPRLANDIQARPNEQMIRVAENDLRAGFAQFAGVKRLHASLRADRHEHWRINHTACGRDPPQSRLGLLI